jgi:hypothetical protein
MGRQRGTYQYTERKNAALYAMLTSTALQEFDKKVYRYDPKMSRQEFLERLARGTLDPVKLLRIFFYSFYRSILKKSKT